MPPEDSRQRVLASVVTVAGRVGLARITVDEVAGFTAAFASEW